MKKMIKGNPYWYLVQSVRVNGKPRPKVLAYLGSQSDFVSKLLSMYCPEEKNQKTTAVSSGSPIETESSGFAPTSVQALFKSKSFGAVAALYATAKDLHLPSILSRHLSSQIRGGLSVGEVLLAGAIHRALSTGSKSDFATFAAHTYLPQLMDFEPADLTSQCFWDQMDTVTEEQIMQIEKSLTEEIVKQYKPDLDILFYDTTNFFSFIDTQNTQNTLSQRGHNKQKRHDLRQFSLALLTLRDFFLPIGSSVYEGNIPDVSHCPADIQNRMKQLQKLIGLPEEVQDITFVFDKGGYTKASIAALSADQIHFVTSLSACYHVDLIREAYGLPHSKQPTKQPIRHKTKQAEPPASPAETPSGRWEEVKLSEKSKTNGRKVPGHTVQGRKEPGSTEIKAEKAEPESRSDIISVYRTETIQWGVPVTLLLYESPALLLSQVQEMEKSLLKLTKEFQKLKEKTEKKGFKITLHREAAEEKREHFVALVKQALEKLRKKPLASLFSISLERKESGWIDITWKLDQEAKAKWIQERAGKIMLMTNQREWSTQEIIEAYRGQNHIEQLFRHLKSPRFHAVRPVYHWTDQKIKVHVLICLLGFLLAQLTWVKTRQAGMTLSLNDMLQKLQGIRKGKVIQPGKKAGSWKIEEYVESIDEQDKETQQMFTLLFPQESCPISPPLE